MHIILITTPQIVIASRQTLKRRTQRGNKQEFAREKQPTIMAFRRKRRNRHRTWHKIHRDFPTFGAL
jgi:hypothetical protein